MGLFSKIGNQLAGATGFGPNRFEAYKPTLMNAQAPTGPSATWMEQAKLFDQQLSQGQDKARQALTGMGATGADTMGMFGTDAGSVARLGGQMGRAGQEVGQELAMQNQLGKQESLVGDMADQMNFYRDSLRMNNQLENQANMFNRKGQDEYKAAQSAKRGAIGGAVGGIFGGPLGAQAGKMFLS